jgi:hypothetical protein
MMRRASAKGSFASSSPPPLLLPLLLLLLPLLCVMVHATKASSTSTCEGAGGRAKAMGTNEGAARKKKIS